MSRRKFREELIAGGFATTKIGSFGAVYVSSQIAGSTNFRGIATISSGTTIACVSALAAASGDVIQLTPYQAVNIQSSGQGIVLGVASVSAGAFVIYTAGSIAPTAAVPVAWSIFK